MKRVSLLLAGLVVLGLSACKSGESTEAAATDSAVVEAPATPAVDSTVAVADTAAKADSAAAVK